MKKFLSLSLAILSLTACLKHEIYQGYNFDNVDFKGISVNKSTKENVIKELGSPTSTSDFGPDTIYYISSKAERYGFLSPVVKEQRVLSMTFNKGGLLKEIKEFDVKDQKDFMSSDNQINIKGNELSPVEQILGNVGKFNKNVGNNRK